MNSPNMRSEQFTPKMSPITLCLDDRSNSAAFQALLSSPTKLQLDNSGFYSTSLSKLNDYTRSGRGRERRNSETFRSLSPIRFNLSTSNNNSNNIGPKMLKSEYLTQTKTNLPLLSTLLKSAATSKTNTPSNNIENNRSIKETLEQMQQQQQKDIKNLQNNKGSGNDIDIKKIEKVEVEIEIPQKVQNVVKIIDSKDTIVPEKGNHNSFKTCSVVSGGSTLGNVYSGDLDIKKGAFRNNMIDHSKDRVLSSSSTVFSNTQNDSPNDYPPVNIDNLPTDKNGFVDLNTNQSFGRTHNYMNSSAANIHNKQNNRFSFISSTSTDYDFLFDQQTTANFHGTDNGSHQQQQQSALSSQFSDSSSNIRTTQDMESFKLDSKIKYLEVEIQELKLQNERLINSINSNRTAEDKLLIELLRQKTYSTENNYIPAYKPEHGSTANKKSRSMEKKVNLLEKQFDNYKKVLQKLNYIDQKSPVEFASSQKETKARKTTTRSKRASLRTPKVPRISRISRITSKDLRRIEENSDYSTILISRKAQMASNRENLTDEYEDGFIASDEDDEGDTIEYEADDEKDNNLNEENSPKEKKNYKKGFKLPLQIQK